MSEMSSSKKLQLLVNGTKEFPLDLLKMNKVLLTMLCDVKGVNVDLNLENVVEAYDMLMERIDDDYEEEKARMKRNNLEGEPEPQKIDIPLLGWDSALLDYVIEFSRYHTEHPLEINNDEMPEWDAEFLRLISEKEPELCGYLFQLANYLHNDPLIDVCALYFANLINGRTKEEIRKQFHIKSDFTEEEEQEIEQKTAWIEQHK